MKRPIVTSIITGTLIHAALAAPGTVIWSDNFNAPDTANFNNAPLTGRLGGTLATAAQLFSLNDNNGMSYQIQGNKLRTSAFSGRVQFRIPNTVNGYDWAASAEAASILASGGMRVEFQFTPTDLTSGEWIALNIGINGANTGIRVNDPQTDYGILFRNNGGTQRFENSTGTAGVTVAGSPRQVVIEYAFTSFADGATVQATTKVDGVQVASDDFTWNANGGMIFMELESVQLGSLIDNFKVSTLANFLIFQDDDVFVSGVGNGGLVSLLSGDLSGTPEPTTFALVAGDGDTDNGRFEINGNRLESNGYDFTQAAGGTQYFVRIQGTGNTSGNTDTREFILTLIKDDDADSLPDAWELDFAGNLTGLNGLATGPGPGAGTGDFDNDGISDLAEYNYSLGPYPNINPTLADTDADGLNDSHEISPPGGLRPVTNPLVADTDKDGLKDGAESNTGTFVSALNTGTNALTPDYDLDGVRDGFEVEKGSNPTNFGSRPALPPAFSIVQVTDDASTGISTESTYTHKISGGSEATVNGVTLEKLGIGVTPANFAWTVTTNLFGEVSANNGAWSPATGGVTGPGALSLYGGFAYDQNPNVGGMQTYTLSGLTIGEVYTLKIFTRSWSKTDFRPIDLEFTNGSTVEKPFGALVTDRPGIVLNNNNDDSAYFLSYTYEAQATDLIVKTSTHPSYTANDGGFHLYALTNQTGGISSGVLAITGVSRDSSGNFIIDFIGAPETTYYVTKSPNLIAAFVLTDLTPTTNPSGVGQAIVPATSEAKAFYRIEKR